MIATAIWLVVDAAATLGLGAVGSGGSVAWEAHIGGYVAGLLAFGLFDRRPAAAPAGPWDGLTPLRVQFFASPYVKRGRPAGGRRLGSAAGRRGQKGRDRTARIGQGAGGGQRR